MRSLSNRALFGGILWAVITMAIGGLALFTYFANATQRQFDSTLAGAHLQLVVALNSAGSNLERISELLNNPEYERPDSGSYWQVVGPGGIILTSPSLYDTPLPVTEDITAERSYWTAGGPSGRLRGIHQRVQVADGGFWFATVAQSLDTLRQEQQTIRQSLVSTLGLIGVLGVAAAVLLTSAIVRPLTRLREDVAHRWDSGHALSPADYPDEVAPLVGDINTLLTRNREIVDRARRQTADMAHALKTPSAILRNELAQLGTEGHPVSRAQEALERVDAQINRSLARIRAANSGTGLGERVSLAKSVERLARLFRTMPEGKNTQLSHEISDEFHLAMDIQDLEEVLGNIMENAFHHAKSAIRLTAQEQGKSIVLFIEDDGPGIAQDQRHEALRSGGRLDTSKPGTGLGLAIAFDLLQAYGGALDLDQSTKLGGLRVVCTMPTSLIAPQATA